MRRSILAGTAVAGFALALAVATFLLERSEAASVTDVERGRYMVKVGGCNDCHTPGYLARNGEVPEDKWLIGDFVGFNGPWGTTYAPNLRQLMGTMAEDDWIRYARSVKTRPPMPWFNLNAISESDLRAMHRYVRSLPPDDNVAPDYVPPGEEPKTPYIVMVPQPPKQ